MAQKIVAAAAPVSSVCSHSCFLCNSSVNEATDGRLDRILFLAAAGNLFSFASGPD